MKEEEKRLESEVRELLKRAQQVDEEEDQRYGKDKRGDELPQELAFRESRLKKIREARAALEAERARAEGKEHPGMPQAKVQRNFTDPDSRIMPAPGNKDFIQGYNAQAAVDSAHQVIVAADVSNQSSDKGQMTPMMGQVRNNARQLPREVSADAGYFSAKAVRELAILGVEAFIPPDKVRHTAPVAPAPRGRIPKCLLLIERMRRKLRTERGKRRYALRMETVEDNQEKAPGTDMAKPSLWPIPITFLCQSHPYSHRLLATKLTSQQGAAFLRRVVNEFPLPVAAHPV